MTGREEEPDTFVVDFEPGLYGPFKTRREASDWAFKKVAATGARGQTYGYVVRTVSGPAEPLDGAA